MQQTVILSSICKWKRQKMVVFVVKRYTVREAEKWRYAVHKAKIGRYAVRNGGRGCHPHIEEILCVHTKKFYPISDLALDQYSSYLFYTCWQFVNIGLLESIICLLLVLCMLSSSMLVAICFINRHLPYFTFTALSLIVYAYYRICYTGAYYLERIPGSNTHLLALS